MLIFCFERIIKFANTFKIQSHKQMMILFQLQELSLQVLWMVNQHIWVSETFCFISYPEYTWISQGLKEVFI